MLVGCDRAGSHVNPQFVLNKCLEYMHKIIIIIHIAVCTSLFFIEIKLSRLLNLWQVGVDPIDEPSSSGVDRWVGWGACSARLDSPGCHSGNNSVSVQLAVQWTTRVTLLNIRIK